LDSLEIKNKAGIFVVSIYFALQKQTSKHLKLLWSKAMVVRVEEKVPPDGISWESEKRAQANYAMRLNQIQSIIKN